MAKCIRYLCFELGIENANENMVLFISLMLCYIEESRTPLYIFGVII